MMMPSWGPQSPRARVSTEGITNIQQALETLLMVTTGGMLLASRRKPGFLLNSYNAQGSPYKRWAWTW